MNILKRISLALLCAFISILPLAAESQRSYPSDDLVIDLMRNLYVAEGKALPSTTGPWTKDELLMMLDRVDRDMIGPESARLYDSIEFYLTRFNASSPEDDLELDLELFTRLESYTHTDPENFDHIDLWGVPGYRSQVPVLTAELSFGLYDKFFMFMDPSIGLVRNYNDPDALGRAHSFTNMILLPPAKTMDSSANTPVRAYTSFGGHGWNILLGREKVEWGPGHTGNFIFGDQIPYHDMLRVTGYTDSFKYTFITSFMIHPQNYYETVGERQDGVDADGKPIMRPVDAYAPMFGQSSWMNGISMYMHHRFEWRLWDRLGIAITEGILYQHPENYLDLRVLNPMMIFHNLYMKQYSNSLLNIDLDWSFTPGFNWYLSMVVDDMAIPFVENSDKVKGSASPNAMGFLTGLNMVFPERRGYWTGNVEVAYTDPFLYLRDRGVLNAEKNQHDYTYGLSFITGIREYSSEEGSRYDLVWLGYRHGGDAVVASTDFGYSSYDGWGAGMNLFYMAHGVNDIYSRWRPIEIGSKGSTAPSTDGDPDNYFPIIDGKDEHENPVFRERAWKNAVSHTFVVGFTGYYSIAWNMMLSAELDLVSVWNPGNILGAAPLFDAQLTLGFSIAY